MSNIKFYGVYQGCIIIDTFQFGCFDHIKDITYHTSILPRPYFLSHNPDPDIPGSWMLSLAAVITCSQPQRWILCRLKQIFSIHYNLILL